MQSISKRELFLEAWGIYKKNSAFLLNLGFIMFSIQVIMPSLVGGMFEPYTLEYFIYQLAYMILSTGVSLGVIVQSLRMIRGGDPDSISSIFNYFHKIPASLLGSLIIISSCASIGLLFLFVFVGPSGIDLNATSLNGLLGEDPSTITLVGLMICGIMVAYLSIKAHFFVYFIMDRDLGPINALRFSLFKTNGLEGELFIIWALLATINLMGVLLYMLGLLLTLPFTMILLSLIYNKYLTK